MAFGLLVNALVDVDVRVLSNIYSILILVLGVTLNSQLFAKNLVFRRGWGGGVGGWLGMDFSISCI